MAASAVLVYGGGGALVAGNIATHQERVTSYAVGGSLDGVILDVGDGDVEVVRGGARPSMIVEQTDRYTFDHRVVVRRSTERGTFRLTARCPRTILRSCSVSLRLTVPDNVPLDIRTTGGSVRLRDYQGTARLLTRSGDVTVTGFCGNALSARAETGDIAAATTCPPPQLLLRSTAGSVRASVPAGRYQLEAESSSGDRTVRGVQPSPDVPFVLQALSSSGDVAVLGRP